MARLVTETFRTAPFHLITTVVNKCWNFATHILKGSGSVNACQVCFECLPPEVPTEETKHYRSSFTLIVGTDRFTFPGYYRATFGQASGFFKTLFSSSFKEKESSEISVQAISSAVK